MIGLAMWQRQSERNITKHQGFVGLMLVFVRVVVPAHGNIQRPFVSDLPVMQIHPLPNDQDG